MKKDNSVLEINLDAINNNLVVLQSYCRDDVKQLAVVKADAYGHGAVEVTKKIASQIDWLAVNNVNEGIELRKNGISMPILVFMPPNKKTAQTYETYNLTASVSAEEHFQLLPEGIDYHLLFDTGMGRLGFSIDEVKRVLKIKNGAGHLNCTGCYSHFANADTVDSPTLRKQLQTFKRIRSYFDSDLLTHLCNTGGTVQMPDAHFDMVRLGIGLYGFAPGQVEIAELQPAMKWKTTLIQVKSIKKGNKVSYGSTWQCPADGYLGVIPIGFEDGLPRRVSGNLHVKIDNQYYEAVGIVTMNYTMVYLQYDHVKKGTEVLLLGDKTNARTWAQTVGTIPYEIMTRINPKVRREYH